MPRGRIPRVVSRQRTQKRPGDETAAGSRGMICNRLVHGGHSCDTIFGPRLCFSPAACFSPEQRIPPWSRPFPICSSPGKDTAVSSATAAQWWDPRCSVISSRGPSISGGGCRRRHPCRTMQVPREDLIFQPRTIPFESGPSGASQLSALSTRRIHSPFPSILSHPREAASTRISVSPQRCIKFPAWQKPGASRKSRCTPLSRGTRNRGDGVFSARRGCMCCA